MRGVITSYGGMRCVQELNFEDGVMGIGCCKSHCETEEIGSEKRLDGGSTFSSTLDIFHSKV